MATAEKPWRLPPAIRRGCAVGTLAGIIPALEGPPSTDVLRKGRMAGIPCSEVVSAEGSSLFISKLLWPGRPAARVPQ